MTRRRELLVLPLALVGWAGVRAAELPSSASLADELAAALAAGKPLLVMASLHGCPFCKLVRDSYLAPLRVDTGQPVVQVDAQSSQAVRDFRGSATTHDRLLRSWGVAVLPTVLFFGKAGREVAERLVGASIPDFYGAYLDERVRKATADLS
ncbi:MAG: thioredoxin fold domain-containing protein [Ramlibacter sp.]